MPVVSGDLSQLSMLSAGGKEALWIDRGWRNGEKDPESKLLNGIGRETTCADYAEVDTRNLSTFYNPRKEAMSCNPTPYATTTLLNRDDCNVSTHTLIQWRAQRGERIEWFSVWNELDLFDGIRHFSDPAIKRPLSGLGIRGEDSAIYSR